MSSPNIPFRFPNPNLSLYLDWTLCRSWRFFGEVVGIIELTRF
jgi:hypothetical protein